MSTGGARARRSLRRSSRRPAAVLLAIRPELTPSQVAAVLRVSATDISRVGRDAKTGFGRLNIAAAIARLAEPLPEDDRFEPNDNAGAGAFSTFFARKARTRVLAATLDYYEDERDVYAVRLKRGSAAHGHVSSFSGAGRRSRHLVPGHEECRDVGAAAADRGSWDACTHALPGATRRLALHRASRP